MSLLFFDGFEVYATADITKRWTSMTGTPTINPTGGRRGGGALYAPDGQNSARNVTKSLSANYSTVVVGFNFRPVTFESSVTTFFQLLDSGTAQLTLRINSDGTINVCRSTSTILETTAVALTADADNYLEFKVTVHDTTGSYELRLNGVDIASDTNVDTKHTANAHVNGLLLGPTGGLSVKTWKFDDFYILDTSGPSPNNDFLGDVRIDAVYPTADGNYTAWTPSAGTDHYALVDESTPNETDYVSSSTAAEMDSYVMGNPPSLSSEIIYGVQVSVAALKDDAGSRSIKVGVRSGITDSVSGSQALTTSQAYYSHILGVDPNTSAAWTPEAVNAMEALIESV